MLVREATVEDIDSITDMWKEFIDFHKAHDPFFCRTTEGHLRFSEFALERIQSSDWLVLVSVEDDRIVGHCLATIQSHPPVFENTRYGYIQDIAVTEAYRGHHAGKQLFERASRWFKEKGVTRIELDAAATNNTSRSFWRAMGFGDFMVLMSRKL